MIVSYYWPPAGGVSVQRWLKFAKYLPEFGVEPILFVPSGARYPFVEHDLMDQIDPDLEVHEVPILELRHYYSKLIGKFSKEKTRRKDIDGLFYTPPESRTLKQNLSLWVRSNLVFPDARATWIRPCVKAVSAYIRKHPIDVLITTGPPHTCHVIGLKLRSRFPNLKWIADFRDPWTNNEWFSRMPLTRWSLKRHQAVERQVLMAANHVLTVSWSWSQEFQNNGAKSVSVITNGYDPIDLENVQMEQSEKFVISHIGTLNPDRNPHQFWAILRKLIDANPELGENLEIRLVGHVGQAVKDSIEHYGLGSNVTYLGFIPHRKAMKEMKAARLLLLLINDDVNNARGRLPAKLYEYMAVGAPIVVFGPSSGDINRVLGPSIVLGSDAAASSNISKLILDLFSGKIPPKVKYDNTLYERRGLSAKMSELITDVIKEI